MESILFLLIIVIGIVSYKGFNDVIFREKHLFHVDRILVAKEYFRVISSGFLHAEWIHFAFNVMALSSFGAYSISVFGLWGFFLIYFGSLIGGGILSLYVHRNHGDYRALGASGAVFGVMFSAVVSAPFSKIGFVLIPIGFPAWLMGLVFIGLSIWGIKRKVGNIGHEAHLGGAIIGIVLTGIPSIGFVIFIIKKPTYLMFEEIKGRSYVSPRYGKEEPNSQKQIDDLLDKIGKKGYDRLSKKEKDRLNELSGNGH
jgi:membrane associated rhomboid family serine protease